MFIDTDLRGRRIDQRAKDSRSVEVDGQSRFCGKRFLLKTRLYGDKRCWACGVWFHWTETDCLRALREGTVDRFDLDNVTTPLLCGTSRCYDFWRLCQAPTHQQEAQAERDDKMLRLFKRLQRRKVVI